MKSGTLLMVVGIVSGLILLSPLFGAGCLKVEEWNRENEVMRTPAGCRVYCAGKGADFWFLRDVHDGQASICGCGGSTK